MTAPISFFVAGTPKPQGSKRALMRPGAKHPTLVESAGEALKDWRAAVRYAAARQSRAITGPVKVTLAFRFSRPKSHFGTGRHSHALKQSAPESHTKKPDVDKLARAVLDALTNVAFEDDSCVTVLAATKHYSLAPFTSGCWITVEAAT
jgi:Holliday junction resolvase RusA-like endonuclease